MSNYNADFWEIPADSRFLENVSSERALWYETEQDRHRRYAMQDFYQAVLPDMRELIERRLTPRQKQALRLYYLDGRTQEDVAAIMKVSQSTVSRHLFGTVRNGKKIGGAVHKLRRLIEREPPPSVNPALQNLQRQFRQAV